VGREWYKIATRITRSPVTCSKLEIDEVQVQWPPAAADPTVVCVEPMASNSKVIALTRAKLMKSSDSFMHIRAAVADSTGSALFPALKAGEGEGSFSVASALPRLRTNRVNVTTVDEIVAGLRTSLGEVQVDVLTVDTEGFDPIVLWGAASTLRAVRFLVFEVQQRKARSAWNSTSLQSVVAYLDSLGLDCYWAGNDSTLQRITGCLTAAEESELRPIFWSNVACVRRGDVWHEVLQRFVAPLATRRGRFWAAAWARNGPWP